MNLYRDIDSKVLQTTFRNFLINASMIGFPRQRKTEEADIPASLVSAM